MLFARIYAFLRGALGLVFCLLLVALPEQMMPGSTSEPARTLELLFASRLLLMAAAFVLLWRRPELFYADAALQLFDMAIPLSRGQTQVWVPLLLLVLDVVAALRLSRASRAAPAALS